MRKLLPLLGALLFLSSCGWFIPSWPHLPEKGTCRNFYMTDWGGASPYTEVGWGPGKDIIHIDEPMLPMWGWKGNPDSAEDVCGAKGLGMVRGRIADAKARYPNQLVWLNWSTDEIEMISRHCPGETWHQGADVFSFDSYGGIWDWEIKTRWMLDMFFAHATPEHRLGLVPEAFICETCGVDWEPIDYVMINTMYFDWAMRHDDGGMIYAMAPFYYQSGSDMTGFKDMPQTLTLLSNLTVEYPLCKNQ